MKKLPDKQGRFGVFGGRYIPETLMPALLELEEGYLRLRRDRDFKRELDYLFKEYCGRPSRLYPARRLSEQVGARVYLKREDLNHTGAHKINNAVGQALLANRLGKKRIIAETGAGQHGVATATAAALMGNECVVYMGEEDMRRQRLNVFRMEILGTRVEPVGSGSRTLKDAINDAFRDWLANVGTTHYVIGSVVGPHPYPMMVRDFQSVIGVETRRQVLKLENRLPDYVVACVGGGSNAIGIFHPFVNDPEVRLIGVEAAGLGVKSGRHAATLSGGDEGVLHGARSFLLQTRDGQIAETHSISAGLDYPGVGPEHAWLKASGRAVYRAVTDAEAVRAFRKLSELEGIIPALESAHAVAWLFKMKSRLKKSDIVVVNLSGRGDKDLESVEEWLAKGGG